MNKTARIFFNNRLAGLLKRTDTGYQFTYDRAYLESGPPLSFNLPLREKPFESPRLFPFFSNLASEGWLKSIQTRIQKIDENDIFTLILENGRDMVGAVSILKDDGDVL